MHPIATILISSTFILLAISTGMWLFAILAALIWVYHLAEDLLIRAAAEERRVGG